MIMTNAAHPRGSYFEEFELGATHTSAERTITEADIYAFSNLTGDHNPLHLDAEFASHSVFGQRIAQGLLGLSIASGLLTQLGFIEGTLLAFRELTWKFNLPIFIGDMIKANARVTNLRALPRLGGGAVTFDVEVLNQRGERVQSGQWMVLVGSKPDQE
jgi:acyl dehydratase